MPFDFVISALVTLLVVVDPVGLVPAFVAMTEGLPASARRQVAIRACAIAFCILVGSALAGDWLLKHLGIGLPAFRIAGGLMLFFIAFDMVFEKRTQRREERAEKIAATPEIEDVSFFPMAMPMLAGPGAISTVVLQSSQVKGLVQNCLFLAAIVSVFIVSYFLLKSAPHLYRFLGRTGINLVTRIMGIILTAIAIQFIIDGIVGVAQQLKSL